MAMAPSSPRLPSPPPPAEIQFGPKSPSGSAIMDNNAAHLEQGFIDANSRRRIHPGTKSGDMAAGPPLVPLHELDSAFQLQEHLAALHYHHVGEGTKALSRESALQLAQPPPGIERTIWLYELCRFLISQCNSLIVGFLFDSPPCSASTCPEMRASEWQFLCAVHEQPKSCCAIDYCCHTLDWAANVVTDQKLFPSRFVVPTDAQNKGVGYKSLINVFRRLHRIFAHAWFQHRSVFWSVEGQTGLYVFFKTVCDLYDLLPAENYKLPPEAEGLETPPPEPEPERPTPQILKPPSQQQQQQQRSTSTEEDNSNHGVGRTNTRRHIRSSPSTGSAVTTVIEADEDDAEGGARKAKELPVSTPETVTEEPEIAEVPVIVEHSIPPQVADILDTEHLEASEADQTVIQSEPVDSSTNIAEKVSHPVSESVTVDDVPAPSTVVNHAEARPSLPQTETSIKIETSEHQGSDDTKKVSDVIDTDSKGEGN